MSIVVTANDIDGNAYMCADSHYFGGGQIFPACTPKIYKFEEDQSGIKALIGITGSTDLINLIEKCNSFDEALLKLTTFKEEFSALVNDGADIIHHSVGHSIVLDSKFWAIGSGCRYALGAMNLVYRENCDIKEMLFIGVETAMKYCNDTGGEIKTLEIKR
jgi:ATP-dependent protease HslVU (ClpYQ) peptidase subunit